MAVILPHSTVAVRQSSCPHDWRFAGEGLERADWCDRPVRMACVLCEAWFDKCCGSARSVRCGYCARMKAADVAAIGRSGWSDRPTDRAAWLTLTAPGVDQLPWDRTACAHSPSAPCSGAIGCTVDAAAASVWNGSCPLRWSHFVTELRRSLNPGCTGSPSSWPIRVEFFKTYEDQRRGALHIHTMVRIEGPCTWRRFVAMASKARRLNGFGPQFDVQAVDIADTEQAARKAGYTAKYAAKNADVLPNLRTIDHVTGEVRVGGLRAWSASRRWGATMCAVQGRRRAYAAAAMSASALGSLPVPSTSGARLDSYRDFYADPAQSDPMVSGP